MKYLFALLLLLWPAVAQADVITHDDIGKVSELTEKFLQLMQETLQAGTSARDIPQAEKCSVEFYDRLDMVNQTMESSRMLFYGASNKEAPGDQMVANLALRESIKLSLTHLGDSRIQFGEIQRRCTDTGSVASKIQDGLNLLDESKSFLSEIKEKLPTE